MASNGNTSSPTPPVLHLPPAAPSYDELDFARFIPTLARHQDHHRSDDAHQHRNPGIPLHRVHSNRTILQLYVESKEIMDELPKKSGFDL
jgi:hypothetical protein